MITSDLCGALICFTQAGQGADPLRHNLGYHVGDDADKVSAERESLALTLGAPIVWMNQTHSTMVRLLVVQPQGGTKSGLLIEGEQAFDPTQIDAQHHIDADGLILDARHTDSKPPAIAVMTADCLPVIMSDLSGQIVAAVHAGRVGLENGILLRALERYAELGVSPEQVSVIIGPAICGQCYEVPSDMARRSGQILDEVESHTSWGTPALNLAHAAQKQLHTAGVVCVKIVDICTFEDGGFHSYRRDSRAGRQASIVIAQQH